MVVFRQCQCHGHAAKNTATSAVDHINVSANALFATTVVVVVVELVVVSVASVSVSGPEDVVPWEVVVVV